MGNATYHQVSQSSIAFHNLHVNLVTEISLSRTKRRTESEELSPHTLKVQNRKTPEDFGRLVCTGHDGTENESIFAEIDIFDSVQHHQPPVTYKV